MRKYRHRQLRPLPLSQQWTQGPKGGVAKPWTDWEGDQSSRQASAIPQVCDLGGGTFGACFPSLIWKMVLTCGSQAWQGIATIRKQY